MVDPFQSGGIVGSIFGLKFKRYFAFFIVCYKDIYQLGKVDCIESGFLNYCHFEDWLIAKGDLMFVYNFDVNSSIKPDSPGANFNKEFETGTWIGYALFFFLDALLTLMLSEGAVMDASTDDVRVSKLCIGIFEASMGIKGFLRKKVKLFLQAYAITLIITNPINPETDEKMFRVKVVLRYSLCK